MFVLCYVARPVLFSDVLCCLSSFSVFLFSLLHQVGVNVCAVGVFVIMFVLPIVCCGVLFCVVFSAVSCLD